MKMARNKWSLVAGKRGAGSHVAGNGGVGMRDFGHWTDEFGSLLGASREPPKEGGDGNGGQQGTFSEPHGSHPIRPGRFLNGNPSRRESESIYGISLCPPEEKFQSFTGKSLYRKSSGANYAEEAAKLLLNLP
jgi:hypothetical protein